MGQRQTACGIWHVACSIWHVVHGMWCMDGHMTQPYRHVIYIYNVRAYIIYINTPNITQNIICSPNFGLAKRLLPKRAKMQNLRTDNSQLGRRQQSCAYKSVATIFAKHGFLQSKTWLLTIQDMASYNPKHGFWCAHKVFSGLSKTIFGTPKDSLLQYCPISGHRFKNML